MPANRIFVILFTATCLLLSCEGTLVNTAFTQGGAHRSVSVKLPKQSNASCSIILAVHVGTSFFVDIAELRELERFGAQWDSHFVGVDNIESPQYEAPDTSLFLRFNSTAEGVWPKGLSFPIHGRYLTPQHGGQSVQRCMLLASYTNCKALFPASEPEHRPSSLRLPAGRYVGDFKLVELQKPGVCTTFPTGDKDLYAASAFHLASAIGGGSFLVLLALVAKIRYPGLAQTGRTKRH